jgi:heavy metal sensor kinase
MFNSIRVRLTLWYVLFFGVLLLAFSTYVYSLLATDLRARFDFSLLRTADAVAGYFTQLATHENPLTGAQETVREFKLGSHATEVARDRLTTAICREEGLLATNGDDIISALSSAGVRSALTEAPGTSFFTDSHSGNRLAILRFQFQNVRYAVAVLEPTTRLVNELQRMRQIIFFGLPAALFFAAIGGFFLAGKTLKPVVAISEQAEHISARNLNERLTVTTHDELGRLAAVINALLSRLDYSFRIMREFMADAAHELKTPLAIIHGEVDVSLSRPRTLDEYRESLAVIRDNCKRGARIVSDMLALARADSGEHHLRPEELYLNEVIEGCCRGTQALANAKGVQLIYEAHEDISYFGDEELLKRMTINLLDNAIRYTPSGGSISVNVLREKSVAKLVVRDTGIGIPADCLSRVFDRFFRVDKSRARGDGGSGLGLSIVKLAAEAHGGKVEAASELGQGSTFTVTLPLEAPLGELKQDQAPFTVR